MLGERRVGRKPKATVRGSEVMGTGAGVCGKGRRASRFGEARGWLIWRDGAFARVADEEEEEEIPDAVELGCGVVVGVLAGDGVWGQEEVVWFEACGLGSGRWGKRLGHKSVGKVGCDKKGGRVEGKGVGRLAGCVKGQVLGAEV